MTANPAPAPDSDSHETRVGIRELRHDFRAWLDRARAGERIIVTDRGQPIADLVPHRRRRSRLQELRDQGLTIPGTRSFADLPPLTGPITTAGTDALREDRDGQRY
jgi:prevent-host-death family protein